MNDDSSVSIVLDGFHAWKHATRFGAVFERFATDDPQGLMRLIDELAPDLREAASGAERLTTAELGHVISSAGLREVHHTRVIAVAKRPSHLGSTRTQLARGKRAAVFVDHPRHPGNLGAVVRAVAAADGSGVLTNGDIDPWHPGVVRASAGLHFAIDVARIDDEELATVEGPIFGLDAEGDDLFTYDIPPGSVIAVGAERAGLSPALRARLDGLVSIPMRTGVSSMNLATSVAAALYIMRSRCQQNE